MSERAEIVVIGGGIMGLAIAYNLAKLGVTDIVVVDRTYLCGGASGRNGGGVRAQWSSEANVRLMQESIRMCREFAREMKINVWFRQGGYLFLTRDEEKRRALEMSVKVQNECGLSTRMLTPKEAREIVPELDVAGLTAASFNADDGVVFPWPFVWGFARAAEKLGVHVLTFTDVVGFETKGRKITGVVVKKTSTSTEAKTETRTIKTSKVVNAAGAWSPEIARMLGVELPNTPHRHEICSTEPLKPWLGP
ncbi:MAG: NAD(P)/FAD-dependent oxidoreductase, partial [Polyangiaceae bacterium]